MAVGSSSRHLSETNSLYAMLSASRFLKDAVHPTHPRNPTRESAVARLNRKPRILSTNYCKTQINKIAECILRLPTFSMQTEALQHINFLLTGTGWSTKAEEVITRVFAQMREHSEKYEVHIGTLNNNGTLNEISGSSVQLPDCGPGLPKIAQ